MFAVFSRLQNLTWPLLETNICGTVLPHVRHFFPNADSHVLPLLEVNICSARCLMLAVVRRPKNLTWPLVEKNICGIVLPRVRHLLSTATILV